MVKAKYFLLCSQLFLCFGGCHVIWVLSLVPIEQSCGELRLGGELFSYISSSKMHLGVLLKAIRRA